MMKPSFSHSGAMPRLRDEPEQAVKGLNGYPVVDIRAE
jgi:hypothetical protein